jgi:hypothetical protein
MDNLIQEINGIKYVLFQTEIGVTQTGLLQAKQLTNKIKHFNGIEISVEYVASFWGISKVKGKFLIPEDKAVLFSKMELRNF